MFVTTAFTHVHETVRMSRRRPSIMRRLVATIVTLSFLFALSATSGIVLSTDAHAATLSQAHPTQAAPNLTADVPLIQKDGEIDLVLFASYVLETSARAPQSNITRCYRYVDTDAYDNVPRYLAARRIQI